MGWYSDYICNISADVNKLNYDIIIEKLKNFKFVEKFCDERKLEFDTWCGCGNLQILVSRNCYVLTTTIKRGNFNELEVLFELLKEVIGIDNIHHIHGEVIGGYDYNDKYSKLSYDKDKNETIAS
jgi:hypothetical protein